MMLSTMTMTKAAATVLVASMVLASVAVKPHGGVSLAAAAAAAAPDENTTSATTARVTDHPIHDKIHSQRRFMLYHSRSLEEGSCLATCLPPTNEPTKEPTAAPTKEPTASPTKEPTANPTKEPTVSPTKEPTASPTDAPVEDIVAISEPVSEGCEYSCPQSTPINMACYKCGQKLDCIVDDSKTPLSPGAKKQIMDRLTDRNHPNKFCQKSNGNKWITPTGQQNCDNMAVVFMSGDDACCMPPGSVGVTQCPIRGQDLSNFGTYAINMSPHAVPGECTAMGSFWQKTGKCDSGECPMAWDMSPTPGCNKSKNGGNCEHSTKSYGETCGGGGGGGTVVRTRGAVDPPTAAPVEPTDAPVEPAVVVANAEAGSSCPSKVNMACFKCGQSLDCVFGDEDYALTDHTKGRITTFLRNGNLCTRDGGKKTMSRQQNCKSVQFGWVSNPYNNWMNRNCCLAEPVVGTTQCPINGQDLSNFGTYTVSLGPTQHGQCEPTSVSKLAGKCDSGTCSYGDGFTFDASCSGDAKICSNY